MEVSDMAAPIVSENASIKPRKPEQVLIIEPKNAIHFKGPYKEIVTSHIKLTNPTDRNVWFKVKTTAPRRYCVRPNNGVLPPNKEIRIAVMLQPFDFESMNENRNKHKFMIQTMFEPEADPDPETMWKTYSDEIMDSKLKCVFDNDVNLSMSTSGITQPASSPLMDSYPSGDEPKSAETCTNEGYANETMYKHVEDETSDVKHRQLIEENKSLKEENALLRKQLVESPSNVLRKRNTFSEPVKTSDSASHISGDPMKILLEQPQYLIIIILITLVIGVFTGKFIF